MLEEERLPCLKGWRQPTNVANGFAMFLLATPEKLLCFTEDCFQSIHLMQRSGNGILKSRSFLMSVVGSAINMWS